MSWLLLLFAILFQVSAFTCLKLSQGLTHWVPTVLMVVFYAFCFTCINLALKHIDISIAYSIWSGLGTALIATIGYFYFQEPMTGVKLMSILLIIIGVVGLNMSQS